MSKAIIFDTETTGLDPRKDEILTLSVIDGDGKTLWDRAYRPSNVTVWPQAEAVNHISPEMWRCARRFARTSESSPSFSRPPT